jgi:type VI secretion system protein ImpJ
MTHSAKVVWNEGMHLAQHHFQSQSRYYEESIRFSLGELFFKPYGLTASRMDADALLNGTVAVDHARGIMPDGTPFQFPDEEAPPEPLEIESTFLPTDHEQTVYLVLPAFREGVANCTRDGSLDARYVAVTRELPDETTGLDEKPVTFGRKNFRLLLSSQLEAEAEGSVVLPLARIKRDGSGRFAYDEGFIGPTLQIGGNPRIMELLGDLVQLLERKADSLSLDRDPGRDVLAQYGGKELASYWLSHAVHSGIAPLRHLLRKRRAHPEEVYSELARLAGALCTFSLRSDSASIPAYDHDGLEECLGALNRHIREHLEVTLPTTCLKVELKKRNLPSVFTGSLRDEMMQAEAQWILGIRSSGSTARVVEAATTKVKFASKTDLPVLVRTSGMAGLPLEHLTRPPRELAPRVGWEYFLIKRSGALWSSIRDSKEVGLWIPDELLEAELDLAVVVRAETG